MAVIEPYEVEIGTTKTPLAPERLYKNCYWIQFVVSDWGSLTATDVIYFGTADGQVLPMRLDDQIDYGNGAALRPRVNGTIFYARATAAGNAKIVVTGEFADETEMEALRSQSGQGCDGLCRLEKMLKKEMGGLFNGVSSEWP